MATTWSYAMSQIHSTVSKEGVKFHKGIYVNYNLASSSFARSSSRNG